MFENYLQSRLRLEYSELSGNSSRNSPGNDVKNTSNNLSDLCRKFEAFDLKEHSFKQTQTTKMKIPERKKENAQSDNFFKSEIDPFLCVEKSLQVFAHRITNDILYLLETDAESGSNISLQAQIKPLQAFVKSCTFDERFAKVNFNAVHDRLGSLIAGRLKEILEYEDEYKCVTNNIELWLDNCSKTLDYFSSDDESVNNHRAVTKQKKSTTEKQTMCVLKCILNGLTCSSLNTREFTTENHCELLWKNAKACGCVIMDNNGLQSSFLRSGSVKQRRKRGVFTFSGGVKNGGGENVSKRLFGDEEILGEL